MEQIAMIQIPIWVPFDFDGDGYTGCSGDCDDLNALTYPGAAERDSETACMTDNDEDGYGAPQPLPGVAAGSDCDDSNPTRQPDDNDGDGFTGCQGDCNDSDIHTYPGAAQIESPTDCMTDVDNDGYGDENPAPGSLLVLTVQILISI